MQYAYLLTYLVLTQNINEAKHEKHLFFRIQKKGI